MFHSQSTSQILAQLTDAFEAVAEELPEATNVMPLHDHKAGKASPVTLGECVPLLAIAIEFLNRGPAGLTIDAVETYRTHAMRLLEHIRPAIEREARMTLADWAKQHFEQQQPAQLRVAA
jgi:hypothetical protein